MTLGNLNAIGPVSVKYRDPKLSWTSTPTGHGIRSCSITGLIELSKAQEISEMVNNPAAQVTIGSATGVLEWIDMDGDVVGPFEGWYLLESFEISVEHQYSFNGPSGPIPFSLSCTYLGASAPLVPDSGISALLTEGGDTLTTEAGEALLLEVA